MNSPASRSTALLSCLAKQVGGGAPIADLGCGPGHVAAWLTGRDLAAMGIDLSPGMIAVGRREYPRVAVDRAGFRIEMRLERVSYPGEVQTRRAYLLARHQP